MKKLPYIFIVPFVLAVVSCGGDTGGDSRLSGAALRTVAPQGLPDLKVNVTDRPDPVAAGAGLTYSVLVRNKALRDKASSVVLTSSLPAGVTFVSSTPAAPACVPAGGTVTCDLGVSLAGSSKTVKIHVKVDPSTAGVITFTTTVKAAEEESQSDNNTGSQETTVQ